MFSGLQASVSDISDLLTLMNKVLTTKGVSETEPQEFKVPSGWMKKVEGVDVASNNPSPELISEAGEAWYSDMAARLTLRKILENGTGALHHVERRWVKEVVKTGVKLAKFALNSDVEKLFRRLFVGDKSLLSFLTSYRVLSKEEFKLFADLPKRISVLQSETRRLFLDVLNKTEIVKEMTEEIQQEIKNHEFRIATVENAFLLEQQI